MELLISVHDKSTADPIVDAGLIKRGHVVAVFPDGHAYGRQELINPMFRILRLPDTPVSVGEGFTGRGVPDGPGGLAPVREIKLDLDDPAIAPDLAAYLADDGRSESHFTVDLDALNALKTRTLLAGVIG